MMHMMKNTNPFPLVVSNIYVTSNTMNLSNNTPIGDVLQPINMSMEIQKQLEANQRLRNEIATIYKNAELVMINHQAHSLA